MLKMFDFIKNTSFSCPQDKIEITEILLHIIIAHLYNTKKDM